MKSIILITQKRNYDIDSTNKKKTNVFPLAKPNTKLPSEKTTTVVQWS
jgi:hypothetical protein